jgi:ketosteroid isomerase-like protein
VNRDFAPEAALLQARPEDVRPAAHRVSHVLTRRAHPRPVRVFGDTGVLMGMIIRDGQPQAKQVHVTLVCQKKTQGWQIIAAQLTQM